MDYNLLQQEASNPLYASTRAYPFPLTYPIRDGVDIRLSVAQLADGIPTDQLYLVGPFLCCTSPASHIGPYRHAIDFLVPDGTIVYASDDGRVQEIHTEGVLFDFTPKYASHLNFITIAHTTWRTHQHAGPPEYQYWTQYAHLARESEQEFGIVPGMMVRAGQPIARTGKTGWTDRDHLHFIAFASDHGRGKFGSISLVPRFK